MFTRQLFLLTAVYIL